MRLYGSVVGLLLTGLFFSISTTGKCSEVTKDTRTVAEKSARIDSLTLACTLDNWKERNRAWYFCIGAVEGVEQGIYYALLNGLIDGIVNPENSVTLQVSNHGVPPSYSEIEDPVKRINKKYDDTLVAIGANICLSKGVTMTGDDEALAVAVYLRSHKVKSSSNWATIVIDALRERWPCNAGK